MSNEVFQKLMSAEQGTLLSLEERDFVETHKQIISCGKMAGRYFIELSRKLKRMRDGRLYLSAGFPDFETYVEEAVGLKVRQAYNYIKVATEFTDEYLEEHAGAGITKLTLLAQVTEAEREEIERRLEITEASTKEVKTAVAEALRERDEAHEQLSLLETEKGELETTLSETEKARSALQAAYDEKKKELDGAREQEKKLGDQIKKLKDELDKAKKTVKTVPDEKSKQEAEAAQKHARALAEALRDATQQLAEEKTRNKMLASNDLIRFKVKFDDLQKIGADLFQIVTAMDSETAIKCKNALRTVLAQWQEALS